MPYFDNVTPALETIRQLGLSYEAVETEDVNGAEVLAAVRRCPVNVLIYSGPSGGILKREILGAGKKFLHIHAGVAPYFRGSTTIYYSLLISGTCGASAILLNEQIDRGPVIATQEYPPPRDLTTLDYGYDPYIRADLLVRVLEEYRVRGEFVAKSQPVDAGDAFYIMHPVLRHITILSKRISKAGEPAAGTVGYGSLWRVEGGHVEIPTHNEKVDLAGEGRANSA
ncbi:MAG: hypothetical protein ACREKR_00745 [Candidatus Methylomirabilales bacterium]